MTIEMLIHVFDAGKNGLKHVLLRVALAVDALGKRIIHAYEVVERERKDAPAMNTKEQVLQALRAGSPAQRVVLTYPLPTAGGAIVGRPGWMFFGGKTPEQVQADLAKALDSQFLLSHDSDGQAAYFLFEFREKLAAAPDEAIAIIAFGTSIAFGVRLPGRPAAFCKTGSTFSHMDLGGSAPSPCPTCGGVCVGARYKVGGASGAAAIRQAVSVAARLPVAGVYVTGGALTDPALRASLERLTGAPPMAPVFVAKDPLYSGAIGAGLRAAAAF